MRGFAAFAFAACALVLSTTSSMAGSAPAHAQQHHSLHFLLHRAHTTHVTSQKQAKKTLGFNCVSSCVDYESTINQYFTDIAADSVANVTTNVYSVITQYSSILYDMTFAASYVDGNQLPTTKNCNDGFDTYCVTDKQLQAEIGKVIAANGWPTQSDTTLYFIFTPANVGVCEHAGMVNDNTNWCTTNAFCAYHSAAPANAFIYAVEPDDAAVAQHGCDTGEAPAGNNADSTLSTISHEQIEAITNPTHGGWTSEDPEQFGAFSGSEIGDLCAWNFGASVGGLHPAEYNQVINGHNYYLQQEWSNADSGCVQYAGGTAQNFPVDNPLYAGTGPLVYHSGAVMTSNTVYAIYWVPAAPANTHLPKIAGAATVGRRLKALSGGWSGAPDFTYHWLRCSAAGPTCKPISRATDSKYALTPADAGHRVEVRVTATNPAGHVSATSLPTAKVRS